MKKWVFFLLVLVCNASWAQDGELFSRANEAYAAENYAEAVDLYTALLETGQVSAELHFNLANAHYKLDHIAPSIYHYEKALQLDPGDEDIINNLKFAQNMALDAFEVGEEQGIGAYFQNATSVLSITAWAWTGIVLMLFFVIFFLFYFFGTRTLTKRLFFIGSLFFAVLSISAVAIAASKQDFQQQEQHAIVFAEQVQVLNEPNPGGAEVFELHEGAKIEVIEDFQDWIQIEIPGGSQGWIHESKLKML